MFQEAQVPAGPRFVCVSFQYRKHLNIGRGGAILTDDEQAAAWFKLARFNGREPLPIGRGRVRFPGWHLFMEPERAAAGIELLRHLPDRPPDLSVDYPDLRFEEAYRV
jgi:dTDP-4-amino-4,6-dideoxygalactose transaminase